MLNSREEKKKTKAMHEHIRKFKASFFKRFRITPVVVFDMYEKDKRLPLITLRAVVNETLFKYIPEEQCPGGIANKWRKREIVLYKQCFMYIARSWKYISEDIGTCIDIDHATVLHGEKTIKILIDQNNVLAITTLNNVLDAIREKIGDDGDVHVDIKGKSDTKSVLPTSLIEGSTSSSTY